MNEHQIEQLIEHEAARRRAADNEHLTLLATDLTADLPSWARRRRILASLLAAVLLLGVTATYNALLPHRQMEGLVACNLDGQEEAVLLCADKLLT
ncbi:MAG: hypothetical protein IJ634_02180 [Bacteroidales bacterium]|nr:hypothetical protein [Bacteroidales bacterium]